MYVDDILFGSYSLDDAKILASSVTELLNAGGFPLRKWMGNHSDLISHIPREWLSKGEELNQLLSSDHKLLGMNWIPVSDQLFFSCNYDDNNSAVTKRQILSYIAKLYDPLGLVAPIIIRCKIFMQDLWKEKFQWDDRLSNPLLSEWRNIFNDSLSISEVKVPRWMGYSPKCKVEVHGFSDASIKAIAAVVYLRVIHSDHCIMNLLISKTKVAPIKTQTIPRVELCAAVLLSKLVSSLLDSLNLSPYPVHL